MSSLRSAAVCLTLSCIAVLAASSSAGAQQTTACGPAPAGYNVIESDDAVITGTPGPDFICAGDAANRIDGLAGPDIIHGGDGRNVIYGSAGADVIHGGPAQDRIFGGGGNDTIHGDRARDVLRGGAGNDTISGGPGRDRIFGQDGDDTLRGNAGRDILSGGDELFTDRADGGTSTDTCIDTVYPRRCEKLRGQVLPLSAADGTLQWRLMFDRRVETSTDGTQVVFPAVPTSPPDSREIHVVHRDLLTGKFTSIHTSVAGTLATFGAHISGDGNTVAFAVSTDPFDGVYRVHVWNKTTDETTVLPLPPGNSADAGAWPFAVSRDGSFVLTIVRHTVNDPDGAPISTVRLYRQSLDGETEFIVEQVGILNTLQGATAMSADANTIVTGVYGATSPGDVNGDLTSPIVRSVREDVTEVLLKTDAPADHNVHPIGIDPAGTTVALELRQNNVVRQVAFHDLDADTSTFIDVGNLCDQCVIRDSVGAQGHWRGSWAVFEAEWTRETPRDGIVLVHPDGRSDFLDPGLGEIDRAAISADGSLITLVPGGVLNTTAVLLFR